MTVTINVINSAATLQIISGTFIISADSVVSNLTLSGGTLTGAGTLTVTGLTQWSGGNMRGSGKTLALGGLSVTESTVKELETRTLENAGAAVFAPGPGWELFVSGGATILNRPTGVFEMQGIDSRLTGFSATFATISTEPTRHSTCLASISSTATRN